MRNILLAITSFFATVLILSQVALAVEADDGDPKHTTSAQGEDPNLAIAANKNGTEAGVPNIGNDCSSGTCFPRTKGGRLSDYTAAPRGGSAPASSSSSRSGSHGQEGAQ